MALPASVGSRRSREVPPLADQDALAEQTDSYFLKTKAIVGRFGDRQATYAVFMRRPVISAPGFALEFLESIAAERGVKFDIELAHREGAWVGAGDPILHVSGPRGEGGGGGGGGGGGLGGACVTAYNAYGMCEDLPKV